MRPRTLLWRTVLLLVVLLIGVQIAAFQLFRVSEREPRAREIAQQLVSVVNLTRAALITSDPSKRRALLAELSQREGIRIYPAEERQPPEMRIERPAMMIIEDEMRRQLGANTRAVLVPGNGGMLWASFEIDRDSYWLVIPRGRLERPFSWRWVGWIGGVLALATLCGWLIVYRINRPLRSLTHAAIRLGQGGQPLPVREDGPEEIRALTRAFNRMSSELAHLDADRKLLLAGVSHDLRTPLARLRLAVEMLSANADSTAKAAMVQDIEDMDTIIGQFVAFVKEGDGEDLRECDLNELAQSVAERYARLGQPMKLELGAVSTIALRPMAMQRLLTNLLDNAFKHGRSPTAQAEVTVQTWQQSGRIYLSVLDRGPGVPESEVPRLLQPFERLENARSNLSGSSGLGLAIVDRIARMHDGRLHLLARAGGGLEARVELVGGARRTS
jgi:two-component system osmolarity sensor histidine kinase EnvZ